jgi:hypothetical protein
MMEGSAEIEALLRRAATRFQAMGVQRLVIFSGHFADEQLEMIGRFAETWNAIGMMPPVTETAVNPCFEAEMAPDHTDAFETILVHAIAAATADLSQLPTLADCDHPIARPLKSWPSLVVEPRWGHALPAFRPRILAWKGKGCLPGLHPASGLTANHP